MELRNGRERCKAGLQFGSRLVGGLMPGRCEDYLDEDALLETRNIDEFAGMLALDKWTGNVNGRQAVFWRKAREKRHRATFIDQGYCFNAGEWRFADGPLKGVYARNAVYREVTGWQSFEPWLARIEAMSPEKIWGITETVPPEWYGGEIEALETTDPADDRAAQPVRELIVGFRESSRSPFPKWMEAHKKSVDATFAMPNWTDNSASKFVM